MAEKLPVAFVAGLLSVLTPCVLPLVPGYLAAISTVEVERLGERGVGRRIVVASLPFIAGFMLVFVVLGAAAAAIGSAVDKQTQLRIAGFVLGMIARGVVLLVSYSLGLGAAFVVAGVGFAHAMRAFRWVRDHYGIVRGLSGATLVALGLLLFFNRDWWLQVALDQVFTRIGLGTL
jgi:cytochrome c biogenesis protein CcdA